MNIVPYSSEPYFQPGRASELVAEVLPAARSRDPQRDDPGQRATPVREEGKVNQQGAVISPLEREALLHQRRALQERAYQAAQASARGVRAMNAYADVAQAEKRDLLDDLLGVSEYA